MTSWVEPSMGTAACGSKCGPVGDETTLAGIMKLVEEAQEARSRGQMLADRAAAALFYVPIGVAC